jgi:hypothetical protein
MSPGISRRHWLLALLTGLAGPWLARLWPAVRSQTAAMVPPPRTASLQRTTADPVSRVVTYVYDGSRSPWLAPGGAALHVTTFTYDARG